MPPWPICAVMNNPPDGFFEESITEDLSQVAHHIIGSSSDSEEDSPANNGYELLPQEPDLEVETENLPVSHDDELDRTIESVSLSNPGSVILHESLIEENTVTLRDELDEVWKGSCEQHNEPMDPEHAEKVKAAMANFTLPNSAVPAWAKLVPEEEWKAELVASLKSRNVCDVQTANNNASLRCEGPSLQKCDTV